MFCVSVCLRSIWKLVTNIQTLWLYQKSCQYYLHEQENLLNICAAVLRISQLTWWRCFSIPQDMFNSTYYPDTFVRTHYYSGERSKWAISDLLICFVMLIFDISFVVVKVAYFVISFVGNRFVWYIFKSLKYVFCQINFFLVTSYTIDRSCLVLQLFSVRS